MYVTDTHSWLWYLSDDERLGEEARKIFESVDRAEEKVFIPGIVLAEAVYVVKSHDYEIEMKKIVNDLKSSRNYRMKTMDYRLIEGLVSDDRKLSIHDKIVVLTAEQLEATILSKDEAVSSLADVDVVW